MTEQQVRIDIVSDHHRSGFVESAYNLLQGDRGILAEVNLVFFDTIAGNGLHSWTEDFTNKIAPDIRLSCAAFRAADPSSFRKFAFDGGRFVAGTCGTDRVSLQAFENAGARADAQTAFRLAYQAAQLSVRRLEPAQMIRRLRPERKLGIA